MDPPASYNPMGVNPNSPGVRRMFNGMHEQYAKDLMDFKLKMEQKQDQQFKLLMAAIQAPSQQARRSQPQPPEEENKYEEVQEP